MIPFGYRIADAKAMVDPEEARVLKDFFRRFTAGGEVKAAAEEAGLRMAPATCKRILLNPIYAGTEDYPAIISMELYEAAQERLKMVSRIKKGSRRIPEVSVYKDFVAETAGERGEL